ncbi:MAG: hypothetical protein ABW023_04745 [Sphingomonas sp.]
MAWRGRAGIGLALLAGGCGDDPANIPRQGKWQRETRLIALVANDVWVDRKYAPFAIPEDGTEVEACAEPRLRSRDEVNRELLGRVGKVCTIDALDHRDGKITGSGTCGPTETDGRTVTGTIEVDGVEKPDRLGGKISIAVQVREVSGRSDRVRMGLETVWTRLGDCGR